MLCDVCTPEEKPDTEGGLTAKLCGVAAAVAAVPAHMVVLSSYSIAAA